MSILYGLPFLCDVLLYYAALGLFGLLSGLPDTVALVPLTLFAGCALSGALARHDRLRWVGMAAALPIMFMVPGWGARIALLVPIAYLALFIYNNRRPTDYSYAATRFRYSLIVTGVVLLLTLMFSSPEWKRGLPYLFSYFALSVTTLRLLRHDTQISRSRRFRMLNAASVALVCLAGFGLALPGAQAVLLRLWGLFRDYVLWNILRLVGWALQLVLMLIARLFQWLGWNAGGALTEMPRLSMNGGEDLLNAAEKIEPEPFSPWVRFLLIGAGIALAAKQRAAC